MFEKGDKNINWNGGVSEYQNHSEMKRNRLIKLKESNFKCEVCNDEAKYIHHLDGNKDNQDMNNLSVLCNRCHRIIHADKWVTQTPRELKTSKYIRLYGMSIREMIAHYGFYTSYYVNMHKNGTLKDFLESKNPLIN